MPHALNGLLGATAFFCGGIVFDGLADLIDRMPLESDMQQFAAFEVKPAPQITCKQCGKPMQAHAEEHVLGALCSPKCEELNREHYE